MFKKRKVFRDIWRPGQATEVMFAAAIAATVIYALWALQAPMQFPIA